MANSCPPEGVGVLQVRVVVVKGKKTVCAPQSTRLQTRFCSKDYALDFWPPCSSAILEPVSSSAATVSQARTYAIKTVRLSYSRCPTVCSPVYTRPVLAACTIANIVKSSLGPLGLDKMLVDNIGVRVVTGLGLHLNETRELGSNNIQRRSNNPFAVGHRKPRGPHLRGSCAKARQGSR